MADMMGDCTFDAGRSHGAPVVHGNPSYTGGGLGLSVGNLDRFRDPEIAPESSDPVAVREESVAAIRDRVHKSAY